LARLLDMVMLGNGSRKSWRMAKRMMLKASEFPFGAW
jgi:hypothetical protein